MGAVRQQQQQQQQQQEDEIISHYGSLSGETITSRRSRRDYMSVRKSAADSLARNLRDYHANESLDAAPAKSAASRDTRWNKSFHHFRILVVMLGGISVGLMMFLRYSISISMLRMVNQTHLYLEKHPNNTVDDFLAEGYSLGGEFNWNNEMIQIILSWYMLTYTLPQVALSRLGAKVGCRLAVPCALAVCAASMLLTPWVAYFGGKYVVMMRLVQGLGATIINPMLMHLIERWMRYDDISFGLSIAQTLSAITVTLTPLVTGTLAEIDWKLSFYVPGIFTLAFGLLWLILIADSPESSKFISLKELRYIRQLDGFNDAGKTSDRSVDRKESTARNQVVTTFEDELAYKPDSPFQILREPSFYAHALIWSVYCITYCGFNFILPTYLRQFLKIQVSQNGFYCFIIQMGGIVSVLWPHPLLCFLQRLGLSTSHSRSISFLLCCSMVGVTWLYVGAFHSAQLFLLFLNRCFHGGNDVIVVGALMSNYAKAGLSSTVFALINTIGNLSLAGSSTLIGWVLDYTGQSRAGWCLIFSALGVSQLVACTVFALFIDSEPVKFKNKRQSVAQPHKQNPNDSKQAT